VTSPKVIVTRETSPARGVLAPSPANRRGGGLVEHELDAREQCRADLGQPYW